MFNTPEQTDKISQPMQMGIHVYEKQPTEEPGAWEQLPYTYGELKGPESLHPPFHFHNFLPAKGTIDELDTPENLDSDGVPIWGFCCPPADSFRSVHPPEDTSFAYKLTNDTSYGSDGRNDNWDMWLFSASDGHDEVEVTSQEIVKSDDGESEEMPASIESWTYQMSSSSNSGSEYEYGFLPGMQKTADCRRAISNVAKLAADGGNDILMMDDDLSDNNSELSFCGYSAPFGEFGGLEDVSSGCRTFVGPKQVQHSWGEYFCPTTANSFPDIDFIIKDTSNRLAYGSFPSHSTSPIDPLENPSCIPFGTLYSFKNRGVSSVFVPLEPISQQHQQQSQQTHTPQTPPHPYHHQRVERELCYQYQPPAPQDTYAAGGVFTDSTASVVESSVVHICRAPREKLGMQLVQHVNSPPGPTDLIPNPPLERRGGRPVPPNETDPRWNIWTVGNLDIRCTASGVGVKHLKQVLYRDDNCTGYRRSKWTHKKLSAEVMVRRAKQEATNRVVGRPQDFLAHQGWWFYIGTSQNSV